MWLSPFVLSQSTSWPVQTSLLYTLWRRLAACCQPVCPHGSSRLFPSNRNSSSSNNSKHSNSSNNNLILHRSATWCKSCIFSQHCVCCFKPGFQKASPSLTSCVRDDDDGGDSGSDISGKSSQSTDHPLNTEILYYWPSRSACMISIPWP